MTLDEALAEVDRLKAAMAKKVYFVMFREVVDAARLKPVLLDHYRWIIAQEKAGHVFASGPLQREGGQSGVGMTIFRAADFAGARALAASDPFVASGAVEHRVERWQVNEGRINVSVDLSDQTCRIE